jgi:hypothetical protein
MSDERKSELMAALSSLRRTPEGQRDHRMLYLYGLMVTGGAIGVNSYMQFFDKETHRSFDTFLNKFDFNESDLKMNSFSRMLAHLNPALYREFNSYEEFLEYRDIVLKTDDMESAAESNEKFYYKIKDPRTGRYYYYRSIGMGDPYELKVDNPSHLLGVPFIMDKDGFTHEQSMSFVSSKEGINPEYHTLEKPIFDLISEIIRSNIQSEDPFLRKNTSNGQTITYETSETEFMSKIYEKFMEDSEAKPVVFVSPDIDMRSEVIDNISNCD